MVHNQRDLSQRVVSTLNGFDLRPTTIFRWRGRVPAWASRRSGSQNGPLALDVNAFTALGPQPERMAGCQGCFDYGTTRAA